MVSYLQTQHGSRAPAVPDQGSVATRPLGLEFAFWISPRDGSLRCRVRRAVSVGQAYIEIGMAWYRASSKGWYSSTSSRAERRWHMEEKTRVPTKTGRKVVSARVSITHTYMFWTAHEVTIDWT